MEMLRTTRTARLVIRNNAIRFINIFHPKGLIPVLSYEGCGQILKGSDRNDAVLFHKFVLARPDQPGFSWRQSIVRVVAVPVPRNGSGTGRRASGTALMHDAPVPRFLTTSHRYTGVFLCLNCSLMLSRCKGSSMTRTGWFLMCDTTFRMRTDLKSTRLNSSHVAISYAVFCFI